MSNDPKDTSNPLRPTDLWSSFSIHEGANRYDDGTRWHPFVVSVILDRGVWKHFSGVRLMIVYDDNAECKDIVRLLFVRIFYGRSTHLSI